MPTALNVSALTDVARLVVGEFGVERMAELLGISKFTLYRKLNVGDDGAHLSLEEAARISIATGDARIANVFAALLGCMPPLPMPDVVPAGNVLRTVTTFAREAGAYCDLVGEVMDDGDVTDNERRECEAALGRLMQKAAQAQSLVHACNEAAKPSHERRQATRRKADRESGR